VLGGASVGAWFVSFAGAAALAFESGAVGTVSFKVSPTVCKTETLPCNAGIEINKAVSIYTVAETIVILESTEAVPRGPKAVFEILLVNNAPASVLPG